jgi:hypothetical protein
MPSKKSSKKRATKVGVKNESSGITQATPNEELTKMMAQTVAEAAPTMPAFDPQRALRVAMFLITKAEKVGTSPLTMASAAKTIMETIDLYLQIHNKRGDV